jgi:formamidopyrimidine-DNA glycosylase
VPELPEVETVVRDLRGSLVGRRIVGVRAGRRPLRRRWSPAWNGRLLGRRVGAVRRRGKWIDIELEGGPHLVVHLGMTGQLRVVRGADARAAHTHLVIDLAPGGRQLRFRDVRRFGSATLFGDRAAVEEFFRGADLGPEPFELQARGWRQCLAATRRCVKAVLLDQRVVAGVGNIYADEALFEARLHPGRRARDVKPREAERLRRAVVTVLDRAIEKRGSSIRDYLGGNGRAGDYQKEFRVYHQTGKPCPRCDRAIVQTRLAGRSTHYCPACQPPGR